LLSAGLFNHRTFVEQLLAVALARYALDGVDVTLHAVTASSSSVATMICQMIEKPYARRGKKPQRRGNLDRFALVEG